MSATRGKKAKVAAGASSAASGAAAAAAVSDIEVEEDTGAGRKDAEDAAVEQRVLQLLAEAADDMVGE